MPNARLATMCMSATDVRELVSIAIERKSRGSLRVYRATDATGPREAIERPGAIVYKRGPRKYSMEGINPRSISPACKSSAQRDGTSNLTENADEPSRP